MARRILEQTNHLLLLYRHHIGKTEVPIVLHDAACLAGIAAACEDRIWFEKFKGSRLTPSLYTFLVAPSAIGKGDACDRIMTYVSELPINNYVGMITAEKMLERMSGTPKKGEDDVKRSKIFLVQEELAMCVGTGPQAFNFVKHMTGLYKRGQGKIEKATVTGANATIYKQNINWLAGTTTKWMTTSIPQDAIEGGFIGRLYGVSVDYNLDLRYVRPIYPPDYDEVVEHLHKRFRKISRLEGQFKMSAKAAALEEHWYKNRPAPTDESMIPTFKRQHDMVLKMSMIFSLCESYDFIIRNRHFIQGRDTIMASEKTIRAILHASSTNTGGTNGVEIARDIIHKSKKIQRSTLMLMVARKGLDKRALDSALDTLMTENSIKTYTEPRAHGPAARMYEWAAGRTRF